jgi:phosphatidylglycerophosphate synthase
MTAAPDDAPPGVFVEVGPEGGHRLRVAGVTVIERVLRGLAREGVTEALVAAAPVRMTAEFGLRVVWDERATTPSGWRRVRGDELLGRRIAGESDRRAAEYALCRSLSLANPGLVDQLINWRLSLPITRLLSYTPLRPNHVTIVASLLGLLGAALVLEGDPRGIAVSGLLLEAQMILDCCDGQLARLRFQGSALGQWLDNVSDDVIDITFITCAGLALGGPWAVAAIAAGIGRAWAQGMLFHEVYRRTGTGDVFRFRIWFEPEERSMSEVFQRRSVGEYIRAFGRRDTYVFMWMLLCLFGQLEAVVVYGVFLGALITVLMTLHVCLRRPLPRRA